MVSGSGYLPGCIRIASAGRKVRPFAICMMVTLLGLASFGIQAQTLSLQLNDSNGKAIHGAVVLLDAGGDPELLPGAVMDQVDMQFVPHVLVVPVGTRVHFPNSDDVRHHVYSFSPAKRFELRLFKGSEAPPVVFDKPGAVVLGCNIHDRMRGYILVVRQDRHVLSDSDGRAEFVDLPAGDWPITVWHPRLEDAEPLDLGVVSPGSHVLQIDLPAEATPEEPVLSPLQQRFRRAADHARD